LYGNITLKRDWSFDTPERESFREGVVDGTSDESEEKEEKGDAKQGACFERAEEGTT
jgi:hypothetical protein